MTKFNISVQGLDSVINEFSARGVKARNAADRVTETYTRKMANDSASMAPVKSGDLRANLLASPRRVSNSVWEYGGTLAYTRRQEYEHSSKRGFIRKSVWRNRNDYREAVRREVTKK